MNSPIESAVATSLDEQSATGAEFSTSETSRPPAFKAAAEFLRKYWLRVVAISLAVLAPCWWHSRIEAGDLSSHTYNAWLAQMIDRGQAPGLWIARQWNNVLFDIALTDLGRVIDLRMAEKIIVSGAVLLFFWGAFALIAVLAGHTPWSLMPLVAMIAYGWTFQMGFLNYYISLGIAFIGLAIVVRGKNWEQATAVLLLPIAWMAHPLGACFLAGAGAYVYIAQRCSKERHKYLVLGSGLLVVAICLYLGIHYVVIRGNGALSYLRIAGADQLFLYGPSYSWLATCSLLLLLACVAIDLLKEPKTDAELYLYSLSLELFAIVVLLTFLIPEGILFPKYAAPVGLLPERLTSITAILACSLVARAKPQIWHWAGFLGIAAIFFVFLYGDTGKLNRMEDQAGRYERVLPPGEHIVSTIWPFLGSRVLIQHLVDRSCIGYCLSYGNYEPSSGQFRVRAEAGNKIVVADAKAADAIESGEYIVRKKTPLSSRSINAI